MSYAAEIARAVAPFEPADLPALLQFQREYFGATARQLDAAFCDWLFERNPHRPRGEPALWLCKRDGAIVGQQAGLPVVLQVGDREYLGSWGIDLMVHPRWRLKGVGPALTAVHAASADVVLGLGLSDAAFKGHVRAGWTDMGWVPIYVRPLDPAITRVATNAPKFVSRLAPRFLVGGSARLAGCITGTLQRARLERVAAFDERVEAVWAAARRDYPVLVKRDFAWLRWRFDEVPNRGIYERYYFVRGGNVIGYAVVRSETWRGHPVAWLVDFLTSRRSLPALLARVIGEMDARRMGAVFMEHVLDSSERLLRTLGCFRLRPSSHFVYDPRERDSALAAALRDRSGWLLTCADSDMDHKATLGTPTPEELQRSAQLQA